MAYGVVRTDNVKATKNGNIRSAKFYDASGNAAAIENGMLVEVSELLNASTNREIFKAVTPSAGTALNIGIVATPELIYDESLKSKGALENFRNEAGMPITVLMLAPGDILSVSDECIDPINSSTPVAKGQYVYLTTSTQWKAVANLNGVTSSLTGQIIARELYKQGKYLNVIRVDVAN